MDNLRRKRRKKIGGRNRIHTVFLAFLCCIFVLSFGSRGFAKLESKSLVVYSSQKEHILSELLKVFEKTSGVSVRLVYDQAGPLIQRLKAESSNSPADIFMAVDAGNLWLAAEQGLLQPVDSEELKSVIPAHLRDPQNRWFGYSLRARTIVYNTNKVKPEELSSYEDLGQAQWKKRLCLRTSQHVYNQSLVALYIDAKGENEATKLVKGWVNNLAAPPFANDTQLLQAIASGRCDVGISNSYYLARLKAEDKDFPVGIFWPSQGVHVNVFGAGMARWTKNPGLASLFLTWLSGEEAQRLIAEANYEYPVRKQINPHAVVQQWGAFKMNEQNLSLAGQLQSAAVRLMDRVRYR